MIYSNAIGRLGADASEDQTPKGKKFYTFNIASDSFENGQASTEWVRITVFDESLFKKAASIKKGSQVSVHGKFRSRAYLSKDGTPKASLEIIANAIDFVSGHSGTTSSIESKEENPDNFDCGGKIEKPKNVKAVKVEEDISSDEVDDLPF